MDFIFIFLFVLVLISNAILAWLYWSSHKRKDTGESEITKLLFQQMNDLGRSVDQKMGDTTKTLQDSFLRQSHQSQQTIRDVTEKLTKLEETNKQVLGFSDQLRNLQETLTNPKQRGVLGEYYLEETLGNVLDPGSYQMQYKFKDGQVVDAVVFVKDKVIPIDSKFSLENYQRILETGNPEKLEILEKNFKQDLKNRIDETSKYVRPDEGTMDFAFMFIPSEAIYYDLLINKVGSGAVSARDLVEYAFKDKHVVIVSPTSFLAYLQTVLQGLRAMQIEESAKDIRKQVGNLEKHIRNYDDFLNKLGGHLGTTVNTYNNAYKEFKKIDKDVVKISGKGGEIEPLTLEKPEIE